MKPELRYGLIAGVLYWAWAALEEVLGFHSTKMAVGEYSAWMAIVLMFGFIHMMLLRSYRDLPFSRLEPWNAVVKSLIFSAAYCVFLYVYAVGYSYVLNPGWPERLLDWRLDRMRAAGISEEDLRRQIESFRMAFSPAGLALLTLVLYPLFGAVYALFATIVLNWRAERAHLRAP